MKNGSEPMPHRTRIKICGLTREQVNTQYLNESPAQRKARDELFRG